MRRLSDGKNSPTSEKRTRKKIKQIKLDSPIGPEANSKQQNKQRSERHAEASARAHTHPYSYHNDCLSSGLRDGSELFTPPGSTPSLDPFRLAGLDRTWPFDWL